MSKDNEDFRNKLPEWAKVKEGRFLLLRNNIIQNLYYGRYNFVLNLIMRSINRDAASSKKALDIGCGVGDLLDALLSLGFSTYGIDCSVSAIKNISRGHKIIRRYVPPLPFLDSTFDLVTALGLTEHLPDENSFLEELVRVLKRNGIYICSIPVEVGVAGLIRHIATCLIYHGDSDCIARLRASPESIFLGKLPRSILDYSLQELKGKCPRQKHGLGHKYYNYKYLIGDLNKFFSTLDLYYWPSFFPSRVLNARLASFIFARCVK